jgi:hypothetical protein
MVVIARTFAYPAVMVGAILAVVSTVSLFWASENRDRYSNEKVAVAQEGAARANERTGALEVQTADLQRQIAEANLRAAAANLRAEQERIARMKIEERLIERASSVAAVQAVADAIKQYSSTPADIFVTGGGLPEIENLADGILRILRSAVWFRLVGHGVASARFMAFWF